MKSRSFFVSFALFSFLLCFVYALPIGAANVSVTSVSASPTSVSITVGTPKAIIATVYPSNATNKSVTWLSSNTAVATVSSVGIVTGKSGGNATITCRTIDGNKTATCLVTVAVPVKSVSVSPTSAAITIGATKTIIATVLPLNATNKSAEWSSSNTAVAAVSDTGVVTGVFTGSATITCKTVDGDKTAACAVTVPPVYVTGVSVFPTSATVAIGTTKMIIATISPSIAANKSLAWSSSDTAVATVSANGIVTGVCMGSVTITCKTADGNKTATCTVTVPPISVTGVDVSPISEPITVGTIKIITATVYPSNATNKSVTWLSSNTAVATVSSIGGIVLAKSAGNATITCRTVDGSKTDTCSVTVVIPVTDILVSPTSCALTVGETKRIIHTVLPSNATDKYVDWYSSNTDVATVSTTGLVTAKSGGDTIITCETPDGEQAAVCFITVMDDEILTVIEPKGTIFVEVNEEVPIKAVSKSASKVTFRLGDADPFELTREETSFSEIWVPDYNNQYVALEVDDKYIGFNEYWIEADNGVSVAGDYAVLMLFKANYQSVQPGLDWSSPTTTPFLAPFTSAYNCLAHCVNVQNLWYDEHRNNGPPNSPIEVMKFMLKQPPYDTRIGMFYTKICAVTEYPMAIYYDGFHFAKVTSWNSDGTPKTIEYKMGLAELVKTSGYDVYTDDSYGAPILYFK